MDFVWECAWLWEFVFFYLWCVFVVGNVFCWKVVVLEMCFFGIDFVMGMCFFVLGVRVCFFVNVAVL